MALGRVVVCDDGEGTREAFVEDINTAVGREVAHNHPSEDLKSAINDILAGQGGGLFDGADIVVIDNRLIDDWTGHDDPKVSAEQLADEVRTRSSAKAVVILNQNREIDFDLRLDGRLDSYADLNITDACLARPGLWTEGAPEGFRPWSWPILDQLPDKLDKRQSWLLDGRLDKPILGELGLAEERVARALSRVAQDFLHPSEAPSAVTFRSFVAGATRATDQKQRAEIAENDALVAKIAGARLGKWLETVVLGPQDLLVDVPHLLQRYPCLLASPADLAVWNDAISWSEPKGFKSDRVAEHQWPLWPVWLSRPAYLWSAVQNDDELSAELLACFDEANPAEVAFCEDLSRFVAIEEAREFVASFDSVFDRRWAARISPAGFTYGPASRFAR